MHFTSEDPVQAYLNRTWRPQLSITGIDGIPHISNAGNVLRPYTTLKLSLRIPPHLDADKAGKILKEILEKDPPYGAKVTVDIGGVGNGWDSNEYPEDLAKIVEEAGQTSFK